MSSVEIVQRSYDAFARKDLAGVMGDMHPEIEWQQAQDLPHGGTYHGLEEVRRTQLAGTLSGGEQQMVAMGRALMSRPRLLLMDEPSMGLAPILVERNFEIIKQVHESGVAILVVEQNANEALKIADRGYVLSTGRLVLEGKAVELRENDDLRKAYLGH